MAVNSVPEFSTDVLNECAATVAHIEASVRDMIFAQLKCHSAVVAISNFSHA